MYLVVYVIPTTITSCKQICFPFYSLCIFSTMHLVLRVINVLILSQAKVIISWYVHSQEDIFLYHIKSLPSTLSSQPSYIPPLTIILVFVAYSPPNSSIATTSYPKWNVCYPYLNHHNNLAFPLYLIVHFFLFPFRQLLTNIPWLLEYKLEA